MSLPISCAIIVYNEEKNLSRCLPSLDFVDEIIVIDSGSTDGTVSLSKEYGAKVIQRQFTNYADQKNFAVEQCKNDWVLSLDADEVVSLPLRSEIEALFRVGPPQFSACSIPRLMFYLGKWIRFGGFYPNRQLRLFRKSSGKFMGALHERVQVQGKVFKIQAPILHYSYQNISHHLQFIDRYSTLFAEEESKKGKKSSVVWAIGKGLYKSFYMYWIRLGILDGKVGLVLAILGFYYNFLKYLKLYETNKSISSFFVVVDPVHDIESSKSTQKDGNQIQVR